MSGHEALHRLTLDVAEAYRCPSRRTERLLAATIASTNSLYTKLVMLVITMAKG